MTSNIKNLIRVKKYKPYYELYHVENNKVSSFVNSFNEISKLPKTLSEIRVVLSSILSVEGSRAMNLTKKLSASQKKQFFFSHNIISDQSDLIYSNPAISNDQLKQLWLGKNDYEEKLSPLIERYENKIECVISEKSSFEINNNKHFNFQDVDDENKINKKDEILGVSLIHFHKEKIPSLFSIEKEYFWRGFSFIFVIIFVLHFFIFYSTFNPLLNLKMNYFFTNFGVSKIDNPQNIISLEKSLTSQISSPAPSKINKINSFLEALPESVIIHLTKFDYTEDQLILTFENPLAEEVLKFLQNINNQSAKIVNNEEYLKLTYSLKEL